MFNANFSNISATGISWGGIKFTRYAESQKIAKPNYFAIHISYFLLFECTCLAFYLKGGSLGKGTAVRNFSDVDLLVVLNGFLNLEDLVENMEDVMESFNVYMFSSDEVYIHMYDGTPFTLRFQVMCPSKGVWLNVDLLPIINIFSTGTVTYMFCFERK